MHRRARHLKPKSLGAHYAFDSRYISGLSDGASITTWNDISGNARDATQATSTKKPTYKTGIKGGNPVARFDGGDGLQAPTTTLACTHTTFVVWSASVVGILCEKGIAYNNQGNHYIYLTSGGSGSSISACDTQTPLALSAKDLSGNWGIGSVWRSVAVTNAGTHATHTMKLDGVERSMTTNATYNSDATSSGNHTWNIGARNNATAFWITGDIAFAMLLPNLSNSLILRIQRNLALVFKIQCS